MRVRQEAHHFFHQVDAGIARTHDPEEGHRAGIGDSAFDSGAPGRAEPARPARLLWRAPQRFVSALFDNDFFA